MLAYLSYKRNENVFFCGMSMAPWPHHCQHNLVLTLFFFQNKHYNRNVQPTFVIWPVRTITSFSLLSLALLLFSLFYFLSLILISRLSVSFLFFSFPLSLWLRSLFLSSLTLISHLCVPSPFFFFLFSFTLSQSLFISFLSFSSFIFFSSLSMFCISFYHLESPFMLLSYFLITSDIGDKQMV